MKAFDSFVRDMMQVCRNGHVITDLLQTYPERGLSHCDRCGAATLDRCPTCGQVFSGAALVPGLQPMGTMAAPDFCAGCGAAFPWAKRQGSVSPPDLLRILESLLRRVPRVIRQLRTRYANRPPFRVQDVHDLEDLLRALLPLHFEEMRLENRTPAYASGTRIDFRLGQEAGSCPIALTAKMALPGAGDSVLLEQWREDIRYYRRVPRCSILVGFVYDPEGLVRNASQVESIWASPEQEMELRCVIAT
jgi:hypothetical protein